MSTLSWAREGRAWPHRAASRFVQAAGITWHVQVMGTGVNPGLLLLHGTGAASHSWRGLMPLLAQDYTVIAPDLPGHGFSSRPPGAALSLPAMAQWVRALLPALALDVPVVAIAGHSAGAAIALRMALDMPVPPRAVVGLNGALRPFPGLGAWLFPALARLLVLNPLAAPLAAMQARREGTVARLIANTGSTLDAAGLDLYRTLLATEAHCAAALGMMASWDLAPLVARLQHNPPGFAVSLIATAGDRAVPWEVSRQTAKLVPGVRFIDGGSGGHLAHEERPDWFSALIRQACAAPDVAGGGAGDALPSGGQEALPPGPPLGP